jgi:hypothetical protein
VLPTGRICGRRTQNRPDKNVSGRRNLRPTFGRMFTTSAVFLKSVWHVFSLSLFNIGLDPKFKTLFLLTYAQKVVLLTKCFHKV